MTFRDYKERRPAAAAQKLGVKPGVNVRLYLQHAALHHRSSAC
jgi:hypothetical protein